MPGPISLPRLAVAFALCGLAITRVSLVLHEFVGHGGFVVAIGSDIEDFRLFLFGGGWVRFSREVSYSLVESHLIAVAGVVLELLVGALALWSARWLRRGTPLRILVVALGAIDILHALFYLVLGTHYGFGDGRLLHHALGDARPVMVGLGTAVIGGLAFVFGRRLVRELETWLHGAAAGRAFAVLLAAVVFAGGFHAALMFAERAVTDDPTYADIMKPQSQRLVDTELSTQVQSRELTDEEMAVLRRQLESRHRPFPLRPIVYALLALALIGGALIALRRRSGAIAPSAPSWLALSGLALICGLSLVLVLVLRSPWWR